MNIEQTTMDNIERQIDHILALYNEKELKYKLIDLVCEYYIKALTKKEK